MEIRDAARPLDGAAVSAFLRSLPARPDLLGLGEAMHFVTELGEARNAIFRHLVEHEGFRAFAIESDCLKALLVDEYVTTGAGDLDEVMERGFSHGFGAFPANRELVRWMREHNERHGDRLRFFGIDGPLEYWAASPREALAGLYALVDGPPCSWETIDELLGPDARWSDEATVLDPSRSIGQSDDARRLRLITDDLITLLETQAPRLSPADRERAELYARTAVGLLRYHHWMADTSPARVSRLSAVRDALMAANLRAIAAHGPVLVFSHNLHLQRSGSTMTFGDQELAWWSAGALVSAHLGDRYAFIASALGALGDDGPPPGTLEGALATLPWERALADARALAAAVPGAAPRTSPHYAYFPLDPAQIGTADGVLFLGRVRVPDWPRGPRE
ncbi:erythromycin esterase [Thermobispora bispora]|uniref:Erythromycin esterase n=1 Tax=Thermobispora bispora (strain ATCC 19993 / DSM 43833 / CBS 139.67 / JCM 10125 / KCTC 9307 / NBRC 14880 / R51) TaxID=469371 RepID=D6Y4B4_THEBD|nr:erythromycin esterase family protein [Thermobispora bispora]ADG87168.1 Erythromycin esterase [Thermobispora bispora DSM 43833]MBO2475720.1 erythromycin esterase [Actinomycetales bacterium]QSI47129.1 erythromycin esterase family protein [Thermobispora bispora]